VSQSVGLQKEALPLAILAAGSGALLRGDGRENRPGLFYLVTSAMWAGGLFRVMLCDVQNLREGSLAVVADKLIVGHTHLPLLMARF
jgi:hypothetical protein